MTVTRRTLLSAAASAPFALRAFGTNTNIPVGLELYSVRDELKKDPFATLDAVAHDGYSCVEFFSPYYDWTAQQAQDMRKHLDGLNLKCYSTHNGRKSFTPEGISKAIELNKILGAKYVVMAHPGAEPKTLDEWKQIADLLNGADAKFSAEGLHSGYHNHDVEWKQIDGKLPLQVIAENTNKSIMLQLDVGTCVEMGADPVAWVESHPGRIRSMHLKDWSPEKGYRVLFGKGVVPWKKLFAAAESVGGVEYYLIEQEGADIPPLETAARCLVSYQEIHG